MSISYYHEKILEYSSVSGQTFMTLCVYRPDMTEKRYLLKVNNSYTHDSNLFYRIKRGIDDLL